MKSNDYRLFRFAVMALGLACLAWIPLYALLIAIDVVPR